MRLEVETKENETYICIKSENNLEIMQIDSIGHALSANNIEFGAIGSDKGYEEITIQLGSMKRN